MSVTVHSEVIDLDEMIPRMISVECEDKDVERLIPWVFSEFSKVNDHEPWTARWPTKHTMFRSFFYRLRQYMNEFHGWTDRHYPGVIQTTETITLPKMYWKAPTRELFSNHMWLQGRALNLLMETTYSVLEREKKVLPSLKFPHSACRQTYFVGGERYFSRPEGAVYFGRRNRLVPIISYVGWFKDQTWGEYLGETLSAMLGQLARNIRNPVRDQEVFVVGLYGPYFYIARGFFAAATIVRVHTKGCSDDETTELKFTRNYDLRQKAGWMAAMRALTRLFRSAGNGFIGMDIRKEMNHGNGLLNKEITLFIIHSTTFRL
ncbi:uncharacterized protein LDX57_012481 [Aspergillus melleus]|uniref:uncharacterized protein n=1 Tax=Aspergillus melleus TaxID=138277 RepID=UPI001E8CF9A8|nr:uncharacterized protein LDX57_012481 [Aspergillus melleus]KAH8434850.1 hypothetical protein LDX57_012481 [Aspergillus melleus]